MGYTTCIMDRKRVSSSPVPVHSQRGPIGQMSLKSSPFCPRSSSRLTQYIIQDHMVSHHRKVYSAKAAIDASVPKSMLHSVRYNDQLRREQLKTRPLSAQSRSQSQSSSRVDTRASCVSEHIQGRRSVQGEESAYFCLESSLLSSPRPNTSFHAKQVVYPSRTARGSASPPHPLRSASEFSYRNPSSPRQRSARSCPSTDTHRAYKAFQDPAQKTYDGDLLQKHTHHFTQHQPFTPRTLKSDSSSYLSQYRYYTPPRRKAAQEDGTSRRVTRQETYHGCTRSKQCSSADLHDPPQGLDGEHGWSDDEPHALYNHSASGHQNKASKSRNSDLPLSSYRMSPEGMKSPTMRRVSDEEEELIYLEFIADVTNEILLRDLYSDRVLERVFERHVEKNKHRLDEDKMRHLLAVLRNDLQSPVNTSTVSAEPEHGRASPPAHSDRTEPEQGQHSLSPDRHLQSPDTEVTFHTKEDNDFFPYASFNRAGEGPEGAVPLSVSTPLRRPSPEVTVQEAEQRSEEQHYPHQEPQPLLGEGTDQTLTNDQVPGEVEELGRSLAEALCVTADAQAVAGPGNAGDSPSDDEF